MILRFGELFVFIINCGYNTSLVQCIVCGDEKYVMLHENTWLAV
jgi:hypothetical protein